MNKHEYDIGYTSLTSYYQTKDNSTRYELWWDKMKHLSAAAFHRAVDLWIDEGRFFPTLGQIKRMAYDCRTPEEVSSTESTEPAVSESEMAIGRELFPLFMDYLNKKTSRPEWIEQLKYFADKHGHGEPMRRSIHENLG